MTELGKPDMGHHQMQMLDEQTTDRLPFEIRNVFQSALEPASSEVIFVEHVLGSLIDF